MKKISYIFILASSLSILLVGCKSNNSLSSNKIKGLFLDTQVSNLSYGSESDFKEKRTSSNGSFECNIGEKIFFGFGKVKLGNETECKPIITPIDLVNKAKNTDNKKVVFIAKLLQTLDKDQNLNNGIQISEMVHKKVKDKNITSIDITSSAGVKKFLKDIEIENQVVSYSSAKKHLDKTIKNELSKISGKYKGVAYSNGGKTVDGYNCPSKSNFSIYISQNSIKGNLKFEIGDYYIDFIGEETITQASIGWNYNIKATMNGYEGVAIGSINGNKFSGIWRGLGCRGTFTSTKQ